MKTKTVAEMKVDRRKSDYTDRPLTEEEKAFAAEPKNYNLLSWYMRMHRLDPEEWYDILIIPYLNAVKKYHEYGLSDHLAFSTVFERKMYTAVTDEYKKRKRKKRMPEGGFCSLDFVIENDRGHERQIESWFTDHKTNIEKQVIFKELFAEFYRRCIECEIEADGWCSWEGGINGYLKCELDLLLEGYSHYQVWKRTEKKYPHGWEKEDLEMDMKGFREIFREVFGI